MIGVLGLTDFYLNTRATGVMSPQVFVPAAFAMSYSLQLFQSLVIFRELDHISHLNAVLSVAGAVVSLIGSFCLRPLDVDLMLPEEGDSSDAGACLETSSSS